MKVIASAPGKLVITGEYAVLTGAPALAMSINRRIVCTLADSPGALWQFHSVGFAGQAQHSLDALWRGAALPGEDPAFLCQQVLEQLREAGVSRANLPAALRLFIDSRAGYEAGTKLGIGTSAAVCVALTGALLTLCGSPLATLPIAQRAHARAQGGRGSGIDVAAASMGGVIRYAVAANGAQVTHVDLPADLDCSAIWTGASASTPKHLQRFDAWRGDTNPAPLQALCDASRRVAGALHDAAAFMRELRAYVGALQTFDAAAQLGICSTPHRILTDLARQHGVVYKPCGAGGGDFGMAFASSAERQARGSFEDAARAAGFFPLSVEMDRHGITVSIEG